MLEETNRIDMAVTTPDGKLLLVITDAGVTSDPKQRFSLLNSKLQKYVQYIWSDAFSKEHPYKTPSEVFIQVMCASAPTPEMKKLSCVSPSGEESRLTPVLYEHCPRP